MKKIKSALALALAVLTIMMALPIIAQAATGVNTLFFIASKGEFLRFYVNGAPYLDQREAWSWDGDTGVLTLDGFVWETSYETALYIVGDVTIALKGENSFVSTYTGDLNGTNSNMEPYSNCGIKATDSLTIFGDGSLYVSGGTRGLYIAGGSLTVNSGTLTAVNTRTGGAGISVANGAMTVNGGAVMGIGGARNSAGINLRGSAMAYNGGIVAAVGDYGALYDVDAQRMAFPGEYLWWASETASDPGGEGIAAPPVGYEYSAAHKYVRMEAEDIVVEVVPISITLDVTQAKLSPGDALQLNATVLPAGAGGGAVMWSSSDASVATVSPTGLVTALSPGVATITARTANGLTAACLVTVPTLEMLSEEVRDALENGFGENLFSNNGSYQSVTSSLKNAEKQLEMGKIDNAIKQYQNIVDSLRKDISQGKIDAAFANGIIAMVEKIIALLRA
ncbi:MAG: Ig-like domain-containing protein [Oscillospiraceae bacterium]|nr:Ig-like domain-containing protein [Oscillospiraceae bacterium]